jgi:biopolymer transport protein ExbB
VLRAAAVGCGALALLTTTTSAQLTPGSGTGFTADANTVALFHFEDPASTALDSTANNRNATVTNTTAGTGLFGSGRVFNGTGDRLEFGSVFNALSGSSGWTIEYFAKSADGLSAPYLQNGNSSAGWYFYPSTSGIQYGIKLSTAGDSNWSVLTSVASPTMDTAWHYYAMTWEQNGALSIYRDGTFLGSSGTYGSWAGSNNYGVWLDYDSYWTTYGGAGVVDDIRFSNVARSAGEIQTAYNLAAIPEPSTYAMLAGLGALGLAAWRRRRTLADVPR